MSTPTDQDLPGPGDQLAGKYTIVGVLGEGGMGVVYEAQHERLGQRVAIKMLRKEVRDMAEVVRRFDREARAAAKLKSPHVARVQDVDVLPDGVPFIVMEYLEGRDLHTLLDERRQLPVNEAVRYMLEACSAMAEAHAAGIVHRDLKPSNLFLAEGGERPIVKVLDFGISKTADENVSVTMTQSSLGTPLYMSPEQIRSAKGVDMRTDVWSLGVILYELLSGSTPFSGESATAVVASVTADEPAPLRRLRPDIPEALEATVMRTLEKKPDLRFQTITELAEALLPFAETVTSWVPPVQRGEPISIGSADGEPKAIAVMETVVAGPESGEPPGATVALDDTEDADPPPPTAAPAHTAPVARSPRGGVTEPGWTRATPPGSSSSRWRIAVVAAAVGIPLVGGGVWAAARAASPSPGAAVTAEPGGIEEPSEPPRAAPAPEDPALAPEISPTLSTPDAAAAPSASSKAPEEPKKPRARRTGPRAKPPATSAPQKPPVAPAAPAPPPSPPKPKRNPVRL